MERRGERFTQFEEQSICGDKSLESRVGPAFLDKGGTTIKGP